MPKVGGIQQTGSLTANRPALEEQARLTTGPLHVFLHSRVLPEAPSITTALSGKLACNHKCDRRQHHAFHSGTTEKTESSTECLSSLLSLRP